MKTSNPVLSRLGHTAAYQRAGYGPAVGHAEAGMPYPAADAWPSAAPAERPMTVDDVVVRTVGLLALTALTAALAAAVVPLEVLGLPLFGAAIAGIVLGLVIAFARITNPLAIGAYAVVEGVFVGLLSKLFAAWYEGIVLQAVVGTLGVFLIMAMLYKSRVIRATPKFVRGVIGATLGIGAIILVNLVLSLFGVNTGLRDGSKLAIVFSLVVIVIAALNFILDFHFVEEGVRNQLPQKYAWSCAFGFLVSLIWMYIEILRLLSYLRGEE
ncbi:MAG: Bax inhibitor-1/YccA family protein [Micromonosporaceae bacterium]